MITHFTSRPACTLARRGILSLAVLTAMTGCGRFHQGPDYANAYVIFNNQSLEQADVYTVEQSGQALRIGTVFAGRTDTLTVPADVTVRSPINIVARLLARGIAPSTGPVTLTPGDRVLVTLPLDGRTLTVLPAGS
jgi:hypothetical protein